MSSRSSDANPLMFVHTGNHYKIHRVMQMLDQQGGGRTANVNGNGTIPVVLRASGVARYPYVDESGNLLATSLEPQIAWRNTFGSTQLLFRPIIILLIMLGLRPTPRMIRSAKMTMGFPAPVAQ